MLVLDRHILKATDLSLCVISAPSGTICPKTVTGNHTDGFKVEFVPNEVGRHKVNVRYADVEITGSPFFSEAYDATLVRVGQIPDGIVNQPIHFDGMHRKICPFFIIISL